MQSQALAVGYYIFRVMSREKGHWNEDHSFRISVYFTFSYTASSGHECTRRSTSRNFIYVSLKHVRAPMVASPDQLWRNPDISSRHTLNILDSRLNRSCGSLFCSTFLIPVLGSFPLLNKCWMLAPLNIFVFKVYNSGTLFIQYFPKIRLPHISG